VVVMILIWTMELSAGIAAGPMLLVARGFLPNLAFDKRDAGSFMRLAVVITSADTLARLGWWDLARPLLGASDLLPRMTMS
jgi:hypothetical protein